MSISGKTLADNITMLERIQTAIDAGEKRIAGVELNLACPNVIGKPIIAYDFDQMDDVLKKISLLPMFKTNNPLPLGVKMPPYFDGPHYDKAASVLNKYKSIVKYVASINTIGNALEISTVAEMPVIRAKGGFAGLSGETKSIDLKTKYSSTYYDEFFRYILYVHNILYLMCIICFIGVY